MKGVVFSAKVYKRCTHFGKTLQYIEGKGIESQRGDWDRLIESALMSSKKKRCATVQSNQYKRFVLFKKDILYRRYIFVYISRKNSISKGSLENMKKKHSRPLSSIVHWDCFFVVVVVVWFPRIYIIHVAENQKWDYEITV